MPPTERLPIIAERLLRDRDDLRHTVLDLSRDFLEATAAIGEFPKLLRAEIAELRAEIEAVQPRFPSHRKTSVLFDDAGLGKPGRERARRLADRIVAIVRLLAAGG